MRPLCIYHSSCPDGFTAAWIVHHYYKARFGEEVELHPGVYGEAPPPDVDGRIVLCVDFSYPPDVMADINSRARSFIVLDHHQTALANCEPIMSNPNVVLDMERSGARITWDFLHPDEMPPDIVYHVEDRDLWRFALPATEHYFACLTSFPYTIEAWDEVASMPLVTVVEQGLAIQRYRRQLIDMHLPLAGTTVIGGIEMPVVNCPYAIASDVAGELAKTSPNGVAAYFFDNLALGTRFYGLRSTEDGPDVAALAERFGGGGHKHAAGFRQTLNPSGFPLP